MDLAAYQKEADRIRSLPPSEKTKAAYVRLMEIFVQDCYLPVHEVYFGTLTKRKAKILFDLWGHFDRPSVKFSDFFDPTSWAGVDMDFFFNS